MSDIDFREELKRRHIAETHWLNGGIIEWKYLSSDNSGWTITSAPKFNWGVCDYRIAEDKPVFDELAGRLAKSRNSYISGAIELTENGYYIVCNGSAFTRNNFLERYWVQGINC